MTMINVRRSCACHHIVCHHWSQQLRRLTAKSKTDACGISSNRNEFWKRNQLCEQNKYSGTGTCLWQAPSCTKLTDNFESTPNPELVQASGPVLTNSLARSCNRYSFLRINQTLKIITKLLQLWSQGVTKQASQAWTMVGQRQGAWKCHMWHGVWHVTYGKVWPKSEI